jgi:hypothetical protein
VNGAQRAGSVGRRLYGVRPVADGGGYPNETPPWRTLAVRTGMYPLPSGHLPLIAFLPAPLAYSPTCLHANDFTPKKQGMKGGSRVRFSARGRGRSTRYARPRPHGEHLILLRCMTVGVFDQQARSRRKFPRRGDVRVWHSCLVQRASGGRVALRDAHSHTASRTRDLWLLRK